MNYLKIVPKADKEDILMVKLSSDLNGLPIELYRPFIPDEVMSPSRINWADVWKSMMSCSKTRAILTVIQNEIPADAMWISDIFGYRWPDAEPVIFKSIFAYGYCINILKRDHRQLYDAFEEKEDSHYMYTDNIVKFFKTYVIEAFNLCNTL